ncbi:MAG: hypothetical protein ACYCT1_08465 [Steroidobacteraceae bacterium]
MTLREDHDVRPGIDVQANGGLEELTEEEFGRLQTLVGGVREDFREFRGEVQASLKGFREDLTRFVGQMDGLAGKIERLEGRTGLIEAWRAEMGQMMIQAQQIVEEKRRADRAASHKTMALVGWIVGGLGICATAIEWFFSNFRIVR